MRLKLVPKRARFSAGSSITPPSFSPAFFSPPPTLAMSVSSHLRQASIRIAEPWICASCSRSLGRAARVRNTQFASGRRCLNTTNEARQSAVPSMDRMHSQYKERNRTTMYATCWARTLVWILTVGKELCLQRHLGNSCALIRLRAHVQNGMQPCRLTGSPLGTCAYTLTTDLPNHRVGWTTNQIRSAWRRRLFSRSVRTP